MKVYLKAISGDCSPGAMSDEGDVILIDPIHKDIVMDFLDAQVKWDCEASFSNTDLTTKLVQESLMNFYDKAHKLLDIGIFNNKYQLRTSWEIIVEADLNIKGSNG